MIQATFGQVHGNHLAGTKAAALNNAIFGHANHTGFRPADEQSVGCDAVAHGAQATAIQAA